MNNENLHIYIERTMELIDELDSFIKDILEEYDERPA